MSPKVFPLTYLFGIYFFSGFFGLVYEHFLFEVLGVLHGRTPGSFGLILAAFLLSLAIGLEFFRIFGEKWPQFNPIKAFFLIEGMTGLLFIAAPWIKTLPGSSFLLFFPVFLMGMSFGPLEKALQNQITQRELEKFKVSLLKLYGVNTLGGVLGAVLTPLLILPTLGLNQTIQTAGCLEIFMALVFLFLFKNFEGSSVPSLKNPIPFLVLLGSFFNGVLILWTENLLLNWLYPLIGPTPLTRGMVLGTFIGGLGCGNILFSNPRIQKGSLWHKTRLGFGLFLVFIPLFWSFSPLILVDFFQWVPTFSLLSMGLLLFTMGLGFFPAFILGSTFPILLQKLENPSDFTASRLIIMSGLGSAFGSFSLILLNQSPYLWTWVLFLSLGITLLSLTFFNPFGRGELPYLNSKVGVPFGFTLLIFFLGGSEFFRVKIGIGAVSEGVYYRSERFWNLKNFSEKVEHFFKRPVEYHGESLFGLTTLHRENGQLTLKMNGKTDASDLNDGGDIRTQYLLGILPQLFLESPGDNLIIGLGTGATAYGAFQLNPSQKSDVLEIDPHVITCLSFFKHLNGDLLQNSQVSIIEKDARTYLPKKGAYQVIISEPSNPWVLGMAPLFSREFFTVIKESLKKGGIAAQWLHGYEISEPDFKKITRTFQWVFPEARLFRLGGGDFCLIGSQSGKPHLQKEPFSKLKKFIHDPKTLLEIPLTPDSIQTMEIPLEPLGKKLREEGIHSENKPLLGLWSFLALYPFEPEPLSPIKRFNHLSEPAGQGQRGGTFPAREILNHATLCQWYHNPTGALKWLKMGLKNFPDHSEIIFRIAEWRYKKTGQFTPYLPYQKLLGPAKKSLAEILLRTGQPLITTIPQIPFRGEKTREELLLSLQKGEPHLDNLPPDVEKDPEITLWRSLRKMEKSGTPKKSEEIRNQLGEFYWNFGTRILIKGEPGTALPFLKMALETSTGRGCEKYQVNYQAALDLIQENQRAGI